MEVGCVMESAYQPVFCLVSSESSLGKDGDLVLLTAGIGRRDSLEDSDIFS